MRRLRVLIVEDNELVRGGLELLLGREPDIEVLGFAVDGEHATEMVEEHKPDVVVVDYSLPGMSGVEFCWWLGYRHPDIPLLMLTNYVADDVVRHAVEAGARGYVVKDVDAKTLAESIRKVAAGEAVLDPRVAGRVMDLASRRRRGNGERPLTIREIEALRLVARGAKNVEIARDLGVTENTVKTLLRRAMDKIGCHSRTEAVALATRLGLL